MQIRPERLGVEEIGGMRWKYVMEGEVLRKTPAGVGTG